MRLDYAYNDVHDRTYERYGASGSSGDAFEYDKARRLTVAWMGSASPDSPSGAAYTKKIEYNYDDDGNRTSVVVTPYGQSATTTSYSTNTLNQYTAVGGATHSWDGNGNLSDDGTLTYEYNYRNEICRVKNGGTTVATYKYDALGRRVEKAVTGGVTERYVYAGVETIATYDGSNTWKQDFVFGQGIDNVLMLEQADVLDFDSDQNTTETTRSFYHKNALGSVMAITDMNEATAVSYRYDPYGTVTITRGGQTQSVDPLGQHWTYAGRLLDEETGAYYYRTRVYSPARGGFLGRDAMGAVAGANLYQYASASPIVRRDPLGLNDIGRTEISRQHVETTRYAVCPVATTNGACGGGSADPSSSSRDPRTQDADMCWVVEIFAEWDIVYYLYTSDYQYGTHERTALGRIGAWYSHHISVAGACWEFATTKAEVTLYSTLGEEALETGARTFFKVNAWITVADFGLELAAMYLESNGWEWVSHDGHNSWVEKHWENFQKRVSHAWKVPCDHAPPASYPCTENPSTHMVKVDGALPRNGSEGNYFDGPPL